MKRIFVVVVCIGLVGAGAFWFATDKERAVKNEVAMRLKDPWSAQFSKITFAKTPSGGTVVCGLVNAKNNMGAYVGYHPFFGHWLDEINQFFLARMSNDKKEVEIILTECSNYGIKF